jgi:hypothetical protein
MEAYTSRRDETLALGLYTGFDAGVLPQPQLLIAHFGYTIQHETLLDEVMATFCSSLTKPLSQEHTDLLERGEEQSPGDMALVERMRDVQRETLMY